ncbi:hypothetical protein HMPREF3039_02300 [Akkermansia sp. KLE1798]|nr:hypothetical protein HMPREF3039_02300 [Akkermansia sp. KLE1798]
MTLSAPRRDVKHYQPPWFFPGMPENAGYGGRRDFSVHFSERGKAFAKGGCRRETDKSVLCAVSCPDPGKRSMMDTGNLPPYAEGRRMPFLSFQ